MSTMNEAERTPRSPDEVRPKGRKGITILGLIIAVLAVIGLLALL